jgi:predicted nucleotidyltransferase
MELFKTLERESRSRSLEFIVIGGLAVNFYGYSRDTADLDLLICRTARADWVQLFSELGYVMRRDAETFIQFGPPKHAEWPVDLMVVREPTFAPMMTESREVEIYGAHLRMPSLEHLIALKLHALKYTHTHRFMKDFQDVEGLVMVNRLDLKAERIRQMFLKYGNLDLYEKIVHACSNA